MKQLSVSEVKVVMLFQLELNGFQWLTPNMEGCYFDLCLHFKCPNTTM